jgi:hypothetical protein
MAKYFFIILLSFSFFACTDAYKVKIPDSVLSKEKMAAVLLDIHLLEATLNLNAGNVNASDGKLSFDIYNKHGITKEQYEESYTFYTENPEALKEVYDIVLNELSKLQVTVSNSK